MLSVAFGVGIAVLLEPARVRSRLPAHADHQPVPGDVDGSRTGVEVHDPRHELRRAELLPQAVRSAAQRTGSAPIPRATIIAFLTWQWTPFMVLLALAGLAEPRRGSTRGGAGRRRRQLADLPVADDAATASVHRARRAARLDLHRSGLRRDLHHHRWRAVDRTRPTCPTTSTKSRSRPTTSAARRRWQWSSSIATILIATLALRMISSLFSDEGMRGR